MKTFTVSLFVCCAFAVASQDKPLPYRELPPYPDNYSAGAVAARMVDGLGFRFYWATEGLRPQDLAFKPGPDARTSEQTVEHIYSMSFIIMNAAMKTPNDPAQVKKIPFADMRRVTLENLRSASDRLGKSSESDMKDYDAVFVRGAETVRRPFWLLINGPISDCLWHVGQVVTFRRSSGNPFTDKVSVFTGKIN